MQLKFSFLLACTLALSACGGSGSGSNTTNNLPPPRPIGTLSGAAVDAVIIGGTVNVFAFDDGIKGDLLGTAITDDFGEYDIDINAGSQPLLLELRGGRYIEEASNSEVTLAQEDILRAITFYESGQDLDVMITPLTNLIAGSVLHRVEDPNETTSLEFIIIEAITTVEFIYGIDILQTKPIDIRDAQNIPTNFNDAIKYGFVLAAYSQLSLDAERLTSGDPDASHGLYNTISLAGIMYKDIRDDNLLDGIGLLNGQLAPLSFGAMPLSPEVYRSDLGRALIVMAESDTNATDFDLDQDIIPYAESLASRTHPVFADIPPLPLDREGPVIAFTHNTGQYFGGTIEYQAMVTDVISDVFSITYTITDELGTERFSEVVDPQAPSVFIDTTTIGDGSYILTVDARDDPNNTSTASIEVNFLNTGPVINVTSDPWTNTGSKLIEGTYSELGSPLSAITLTYLDSVELVADIDPTTKTWSGTVQAENGINQVLIESTDVLGNSADYSTQVNVDTVSPQTIEMSTLEDARFLQEEDVVIAVLSFDSEDNNFLPLKFVSGDTSLGGGQFNRVTYFRNNDIPFYTFIGSDPDSGVNTEPQDLSIVYRYLLNGVQKQDWTVVPDASPTANPGEKVFALVDEYLSEDWYLTSPTDEHTIEVRITDLAGNITEKELISFRAAVVTPTAAVDTTEQNELGNNLNQTTFAFRDYYDNPAERVQPLAEATFENPASVDILFRVDGAASSTGSKKIIDTRVLSHTVNITEGQQLASRSCTHIETTCGVILTVAQDCADLGLGPPPCIDWRQPSNEWITSEPSYAQSFTFAPMGFTTKTVSVDPLDVTNNQPIDAIDVPNDSYGNESNFPFPTSYQDNDLIVSTSSTNSACAVGEINTAVYLRKASAAGSCGSSFHGLSVRDITLYESNGVEDIQEEILEAKSISDWQIITTNSAGDTMQPESGPWYRLGAGQRAIMTWHGTMPIVGRNEDSELLNCDSFDTFATPVSYDQSMTWKYQVPIDIYTVLGVTADDAFDMPTTLQSANVSVTHSVTRPQPLCD